jgi:hypothetical protein
VREKQHACRGRRDGRLRRDNGRTDNGKRQGGSPRNRKVETESHICSDATGRPLGVSRPVEPPLFEASTVTREYRDTTPFVAL